LHNKASIGITITEDGVRDTAHSHYVIDIAGGGGASRSETVPDATADDLAERVDSIVRAWVAGTLRERWKS
jgi:hypothetical protein